MRKCKVQRFEKVKSALQTDKERSIGMQISAIVIFFIIIVAGGIGVILSIYIKNRGLSKTKTDQSNKQKMTVNDIQSKLESSCTKKDNMEILEMIEALAEIYRNDI